MHGVNFEKSLFESLNRVYYRISQRGMEGGIWRFESGHVVGGIGGVDLA